MVSSPLLSIMKSIICILIAVMLILPAISSSPSKGDANDVKLAPEDANNFLMLLHRSTTLQHECYVEGCSFEEVKETKATTEEAYDYFYTYTCTKFGAHCKVPCTHRKDCSVGNWGDWKGRVNAQEPGCYEQTRSRPFMYPLQTTYMRVSCGRLRDTCGSPPTEKRKQCVCRKANCRPGSWKQWTGDIKEGSCGQQTRTRPSFLWTWLEVQQTGSCSGIATTCPPPESEDRKMCSCKYAECSLGDWSEWEPKELKQEQCSQRQTRRRTYSMTIAYEMYANKCPSLPQKCPDDRVENRTQCAQSAKYEFLGCFKDRGKNSQRPRPLPVMIANMRNAIDWNNLNNTIQACAEKAKAQGLEYFAVQYYGECWSGKKRRRNVCKRWAFQERMY